MLSVTNEDANWTTVSVALTNVIRETSHFVDLLTSVSRDPAVPHAGVERSGTGERALSLRTPSVCRVRYGEGRFVFVGRIRLRRNLHIECAQRLEDFRRSWYSAVRRQLQPCHLPVT